MRLKLSQGFQGITSFTGPLIAPAYIFEGKDTATLDIIQWLNLLASGLGVILNVPFL